ncbi:MAG TPA: hypothetical protein VGA00_12950 [Acidiferrobacterales bacterium]
MKAIITLAGKTLRVHLSRAAARALARRDAPLVVEMELYFSCLIRKTVRFRDTTRHGAAVRVTDRLLVEFRPVTSARCGLSGDEPALRDFPIADPRAYVPRWLTIDYRRGEWRGQFGYHRLD